MNIRIERVSVEYSRPVLDRIDLEIETGEFVSIVGQTGCGKSTLLRLILGEEQPTGGKVLVGGRPRRQPDPTCGYVPQRYSLFPDRTVLGNVLFGLKGGRGCREKALHFLRRTGLQDSDAGKYPHQLSGGMQQRVAIAQALVRNPPVLLMDEAFSALDPGTRKGMQRLIKDLWRESGTTIVFVTHNTREAVCLGTRVIALAKDPAGERGSSVALDLPAPHLDFDSDEHELRSAIRDVESATTNSQLTQHVLL
ncbi:MAG TPA: ABC transporter ATP-binding protein [Bryobacteraceae bacterium]|nr:ABC transporter ATP-binding protein [Bryobacteraceae bacterium]